MPIKFQITASEESAEFTPETIIDEDQISSDKEEKTIQNDSELSFHGTESFLPEVKIQANTEEKIALTETTKKWMERELLSLK